MQEGFLIIIIVTLCLCRSRSIPVNSSCARRFDQCKRFIVLDFLNRENRLNRVF